MATVQAQTCICVVCILLKSVPDNRVCLHSCNEMQEDRTEPTTPRHASVEETVGTPLSALKMNSQTSTYSAHRPMLADVTGDAAGEETPETPHSALVSSPQPDGNHAHGLVPAGGRPSFAIPHAAREAAMLFIKPSPTFKLHPASASHRHAAERASETAMLFLEPSPSFKLHPASASHMHEAERASEAAMLFLKPSPSFNLHLVSASHEHEAERASEASPKFLLNFECENIEHVAQCDSHPYTRFPPFSRNVDVGQAAGVAFQSNPGLSPPSGIEDVVPAAEESSQPSVRQWCREPSEKSGHDRESPVQSSSIPPRSSPLQKSRSSSRRSSSISPTRSDTNREFECERPALPERRKSGMRLELAQKAHTGRESTHNSREDGENSVPAAPAFDQGGQNHRPTHSIQRTLSQEDGGLCFHSSDIERTAGEERTIRHSSLGHQHCRCLVISRRQKSLPKIIENRVHCMSIQSIMTFCRDTVFMQELQPRRESQGCPFLHLV